MNKNLSTTLGVFAVFMAILNPIRTDASAKEYTIEDFAFGNGAPSPRSIIKEDREELEKMDSLRISSEDPEYRAIEEEIEAAKQALIEQKERERAEAEAAKEEEARK